MPRSPAVEAIRRLDLTNVNATVAAVRQRLNLLDTAVDTAQKAASSVQGARDITTLTANVSTLTTTVNLMKQQLAALSASDNGSTVINIMAFDAPEPEDAFFGM
jgi:hypothetical protein